MPATITLKFNDVLSKDIDGVFSVFEGDKFNTPDAVLLREGSTYQRTALSFVEDIPDCGKDFAFVAIGHYTACYVECTKRIFPGDTDIWLIADKEICYSLTN
jgi:hypothetical protein